MFPSQKKFTPPLPPPKIGRAEFAKWLVTVLACFVSVAASAQRLSALVDSAKQAYANGRYDLYFERMQQASRVRPDHPLVCYHLGVAAVLVDSLHLATTALTRALWMDSRWPLASHPHVSHFLTTPAGHAVRALQQRLQSPVIRSDTAAQFDDPTLHLEAVAYDLRKKTFWGASVRHGKIAKLHRGKEMEEASELPSVLGLAWDAKRQVLWACGSPLPEQRDYDSLARSFVMAVHSATRKVICQVRVEEKSVLGDLVVTRKGDVYVSDTHNNRLLLVTPQGQQTTVMASAEWQNIQGLALDDTGRFLFVADYLKGICQIELATQRITWLLNATEASTKGIDGLEYYRGSLVAIQNGVYPHRVMRFFLDEARTALVRYEVLDWAHPAFDEPTNGTVVGDTLYYVANSCWSAYDAHHQWKPSRISRSLILKVALR